MSNTIKKYTAVGGASLLFPLVTFAASTPILDTISKLQNIMNAIIPIIITLGLLYFLYGVATYILKPEDKENARNTMVWGIVALFVMTSVWGLVNLLAGTVNAPATPGYPGVRTPDTIPQVLPSR